MSQHATDKQRTKWQNDSNALQRKISSWIVVEELYIPNLHLLRVHAADALTDTGEEVRAYDIPLFLPSALSSGVCDYRLSAIEYRLRYAQCTDALDDLRDGLCLRTFVLIDKARFQRGQRANTRSQGIVDRIQAKINTAVVQYRVGRRAVANLAQHIGILGWDLHLLELKDSDVRQLVEDELTKEDLKNLKRRRKAKAREGGQGGESDKNPPTTSAGPVSGVSSMAGSVTSQGRRKISWIWMRMGGEVDLNENERLHESMYFYHSLLFAYCTDFFSRSSPFCSL